MEVLGTVAWRAAFTAFTLQLSAAGVASGTLKLRMSYLKRLAARYADRPPFELDPDELIAFMATPGWSPETRKSARAALCAFYGWAHRSGRIAANPSTCLPSITVPRGVPRPAPDAVLIEAFNRCASERDRLMLMLATYAGLRRAEIARVLPGDFSDAGLVVRGKGGRRRLVPVHPDLAAAVLRELELRAAGSHGSGWRYKRHIQLDGPLFPGVIGEPVSADVVGRRLSRLLGPGWTAHTLRHRFASRAYAAERDLRAVQELLGHSKPETTARYVEVPTSAKRTAVLASGLDELAASNAAVVA